MRAFLLLLPNLFSGATVLVWFAQADRLGPAHGLAFSLWLLGGVWVLWEWRRPPAGVLRWDGLHWHWEAGGNSRPGRVRAQLDWQRALLLEFHAEDGQRRWLWPVQATAPAHWLALRRALFAPAPAEADRSVDRSGADLES
jgi:hypothetical protein